MKVKNIIYGCSINTKDALGALDIDYESLDFTDSNENKKMIRFYRRQKENQVLDKMLFPAETVKPDDYSFCIIGSRNYENEIREICVQKGFPKSRIITVDYITGHWRRWEKSKAHNSWKKYVENENIQVVRNWHANGSDMQCVLSIKNAAFCCVEMDFLKLFSHEKKVEIWNISTGQKPADGFLGEKIKLLMDGDEALLRIAVKDALDEIPWCTVDVVKSEERKTIETLKRGNAFLRTFHHMSSFCYYDEDYIALQRVKGKGTILDVSAQFGQSMYAFYQLTESKIVSIEAVPELFELLDVFRRAFDTEDRVQVVNIGISDKNSELTWYEPNDPIIAGSFDKNFIEGRKLGVPIIEKKLPCKKLDDIIGDRNDVWFIKLDVEGLEYQSICGCMETIKKNYPIILIEQNEKTKQILEYLKEYYEMFYYDISSDGFRKERISALNCWLIPKKQYRSKNVKEFVRDRGVE